MTSRWSREKLNGVTALLRSAGEERWPQLAVELGIRKGAPKHFIKGWKYDDPTKATASHYDFESVPWHDESRSVVVVENPFYSVNEVFRKEFVDKELPVFGRFIEMDEEVAMKLLVLGATP